MERAPSATATRPFWVSAFLDLAPAAWECGIAFWAQASGTTLSALRGPDREFGSLLPPEGDDHLRVQRLAEGESRVHLDLHVDDPVSAADGAVALGAQVVHRSEHGYVVLDSPGGLTFCFVSHRAEVRSRPVTWPEGHSSLVDQVCLDISPDRFEEEVAFWAALTGWERGSSAVSVSFVPLVRPAGQPLRVLLQRTDDPRPHTGAHLDLATTDRAAEAERHVALGAVVVASYPVWTVLRDPAGLAYCLTDRDPGTGVLPTPPSP
ncbi:MAG: VOC family protein [Actinomycetota bacterium]|nr:VOC family protein [Actinomycetota bacterium]